ncbi:type I secretion protein [Salipiger sp. P9]|uniref:type I secretion protein n=1 Tax=Salipiger pentaromativorans TaxID=2943193 RepID=UPI002157686C|nr:type I secretion protein [Salipiger pentaromativorans]MCR8549478.1 type I secretion protein [Salipiger pentaromativorans]
MPALNLSGLSETVGADLFGANILAHRDSLEDDARFAALVSDSGVTALRYPGGSLTEAYFDLANPDAAVVSHRDTGETRDFIPISDFMEFAGARDLAVTLVIPTRDQLSADHDGNGDRFAEVDETALRDFVHDTVTGRYGDAQVEAFEIGNEYWGSGRMSATEYGRIASQMSEIVDDELSRLAPTHAQAETVEIVVQMGTNFGESALDGGYDGLSAAEIVEDLNARYDLELDGEVIRGNGEVNWIEVNNHIVMSYFDEPAEIDAVDAIAAHVYSKEPALDGQRGLMLDAISETWGEDPRFADLETYVTEWNQSGQSALFERDEDYGLFQAHEMLNMVEEFARAGVDEAHVWPLLQNSDNALSTGHSYDTLSPAGRFYAMMSDTLPGTTMLDFNAADPRETEAELPGVDVHGFYGNDAVTLYIASTADGPTDTLIDTAQLIDSVGSVSARRLGVADGEAPGSNNATATVEELDPAEVFSEGYVTAELDRGEILEVTLSGFTPTPAFSDALTQLGSGDDDAAPGDPADAPVAAAGDDIAFAALSQPTLVRLPGDETAAAEAEAVTRAETEAGMDQPAALADASDDGSPDGAAPVPLPPSLPQSAAAAPTLAGLPMVPLPDDLSDYEEDPAEDGQSDEEVQFEEPPMSGIFWALLPLLASLFGL